MTLENLWSEIRAEQETLVWEGTFAEYFELVRRNPAIARLAHARVYDAIVAAGVEEDVTGTTHYRLFTDELFGLNDTIEQLVRYFQSAGRRLETRKRILLLVGPPASGKSTLVNLLKRGLENYTRCSEGALYAVQGCPMQEEPLHLIPHRFRPQIREQYGLYIEGDLCPYCRWQVRQVYDNRIEDVKVRRVILSEAEGIGIGTFVATDPDSEDISRLVGSIDESRLGEDRLENAGRAFRLDGELNVANRGLVEMVEMLKMDERFLAVLLVLSEEQKIKTGRFGTIYADEAIIAHTNETEYRAFIDNPKAEALQDRIAVLRVPYNLRVDDEVRIYEKMLQQTDLQGVHLSPLTLPAAAALAVLSRLEPTRHRDLSLIDKLRLYNGQYIRHLTRVDLEALKAEAPREGMTGISPRYVMDQLSNCVTDIGSEGCLIPDVLLDALWDGLERSTSLSRVESARLTDLFDQTRQVYAAMVQRELEIAWVPDFEAQAEALLQEYLRHLSAHVKGTLAYDPETGEDHRPDERLMRAMEDAISVREHYREEFRRHVWQRFSRFEQEGRAYNYTSEPNLKEAIERRLIPGRNQIKRVLSGDRQGAARREAMRRRLIEDRGYCEICARALFSAAREFLLGWAWPRRTLTRLLT